jgi:tetratricopeptide (TPR) repeat protein
MRTKERHHLKDNELALALGRVSDFATENRRALMTTLLVLLVVVIVGAGYLIWRNSVEAKAVEVLAQAMVINESRVMAPMPGTDPAAAPTQQPGTFPTEKAKLEAALPKFMAAADDYPSTDAGRTARYHAAATLVALDRFDEAIAQYEQLTDAGRLLGQSARLGKAEAQLRAGQHDAAISAFKEMSDRTDGNLPKEALLLELARAYRVAGKTDDARKTLNQIVEQHADSPFATTARQELEKIPG